MYNINEADAAIDWAVSKGYPRDWFIPLRHNALSTRTEATVIFDELKRRNAHSFLLVTSNYHTGRARRIFLSVERARGGGPEFRTVAAPDHFFRPADWWRSRESEKVVFMEWTKTLTGVFGI